MKQVAIWLSPEVAHFVCRLIGIGCYVELFGEFINKPVVISVACREYIYQFEPDVVSSNLNMIITCVVLIAKCKLSIACDIITGI